MHQGDAGMAKIEVYTVSKLKEKSGTISLSAVHQTSLQFCNKSDLEA